MAAVVVGFCAAIDVFITAAAQTHNSEVVYCGE